MMNLNKKGLALGCCLALLLFFCASPLLAAEAEPTVGQVLGPVTFAAPMSAADAKYLGLDKPGPFTLKDVKSPYVLVEQFNTSCPHCMHEAPIMNQLFNLVQQDSNLKGKLKFMAAAQSSDTGPVMAWKALQKVPFPVLPDPDSALGKALNFTPYPVTMVVNNKSGKIVWVQIGAFESADEALQGIKAVVK
ncbi:MAG: TlpA family protein disulfide reductase [Desulfobaccales bacterium]